MKLGIIHKYWLREVNKKGRFGLAVGDYSGTTHAVAIEGLIRLGYIKIQKEVSKEITIVEITSSGKRKLEIG